MGKTIVIHDDRIEVLEEGYNIIEKIVYDDELVIPANKLLRRISREN
jgi:hypothetical protein